MKLRRVASRSAIVALVAIVAAAALTGGCGSPAPSASPFSPAMEPPGPAASPAAELRVYLISAGSDPCGDVLPVVRTVAGPVDAELVLRELLSGPTPAEAAAGYSSLFGPATADALLDVVVDDGIARVSFRDLRSIIPNASSSCGSSALLAALDSTLAQLPGIRGARYSLGGDEAAFYEWLQMAPPD